MALSKRTVAASAPVPQSDAEVAVAIGRIGELQALRLENAAAVDAHIQTLREREAEQRKPVDAEIARLEDQVRAYCEAHRARLTSEGRSKSVHFSTGIVSWRKTRARVVLTRPIEDILTALRAAKLRHFVRSTETINKAAMLQSPAQARRVPGVEIVETGETIAIEINT